MGLSAVREGFLPVSQSLGQFGAPSLTQTDSAPCQSLYSLQDSPSNTVSPAPSPHIFSPQSFSLHSLSLFVSLCLHYQAEEPESMPTCIPAGAFSSSFLSSTFLPSFCRLPSSRRSSVVLFSLSPQLSFFSPVHNKSRQGSRCLLETAARHCVHVGAQPDVCSQICSCRRPLMLKREDVFFKDEGFVWGKKRFASQVLDMT